MRKEEAEAKRDWHQERYPDIQFVVEEFGPMYRMLAIRKCQRCGAEFKQGGGFDKPAICEDCDRRKRLGNLAEASRDGEQRRAAARAALDFEEVCQ